MCFWPIWGRIAGPTSALPELAATAAEHGLGPLGRVEIFGLSMTVDDDTWPPRHNTNEAGQQQGRNPWARWLGHRRTAGDPSTPWRTTKLPETDRGRRSSRRAARRRRTAAARCVAEPEHDDRGTKHHPGNVRPPPGRGPSPIREPARRRAPRITTRQTVASMDEHDSAIAGRPSPGAGRRPAPWAASPARGRRAVLPEQEGRRGRRGNRPGRRRGSSSRASRRKEAEDEGRRRRGPHASPANCGRQRGGATTEGRTHHERLRHRSSPPSDGRRRAQVDESGPPPPPEQQAAVAVAFSRDLEGRSSKLEPVKPARRPRHSGLAGLLDPFRRRALRPGPRPWGPSDQPVGDRTAGSYDTAP